MNQPTYAAFSGSQLVEWGPLDEVLRVVQARGGDALIFEDETGKQLDFDFRGSLEEVLNRALPGNVRPGPGRPKLGVVAREVSLLPRHWEWLELQPNGASAALRRLVDEARKKDPGEQEARRAINAASRFMTAMAGNLPHYEEATRALFSREWDRLVALMSDWPGDVRKHVRHLAKGAMSDR